MDLKSLIRTVPDFPKPGISFKDITPVLSDAAALRYVVDGLAERYRGTVDSVIGVESRGFIVGAPLAYALGVGLCIIRKPGKLPYDKHAIEYELEYGTDSLEIHTDAFPSQSKSVLVDDLLATGGTAAAALELAKKAGATVTECAFIVELDFLDGRKRLTPTNCFSLLSYGAE